MQPPAFTVLETPNRAIREPPVRSNLNLQRVAWTEMVSSGLPRGVAAVEREGEIDRLPGRGLPSRRLLPLRRAPSEEAAPAIGGEPEDFAVDPTALAVRQRHRGAQVVTDRHAVAVPRGDREADAARTDIM